MSYNVNNTMKAFTVDVNPKLLTWAREELDIEFSEIAEYLKTDAGTIEEWEKHGKEIRYSDLKKIAAYYRRQVPVFFLQTVPTTVSKPKDFRNLSMKRKGLHRETMMAVRRTHRYLRLYRESSAQNEILAQYEWLSSVRDIKVNTSEYLRIVLDTPMSKQREHAHENFKFWRKQIEEKLNIFVFQFPIENEEFDGFSYIEDGKPYAITLNSKISDNRKVFTLFHELGHILDGESGLCLTRPNQNPASSKEARCNKFAAEFLMPEHEVIPPSSFGELKRNAKSLGVSAQAYLIRLGALDLISDTHYSELMALVLKQNKKVRSRSAGGPPHILVIKSQRGDRFFDFVLSSYDKRKLSASTVRDVLNLKVVGLSRRDN